MWVAHEDCINIVKNSWTISVIGCPMYVLNEKLKHLKLALKHWNINVFGNFHDQVKDAKLIVDQIQEEIDRNGHSDTLMQQEKDAQLILEQALNVEELFWQQKSNIQWHCEGDRNTAYFHRVAKIKKCLQPYNLSQRW
jgi:hypothetical protein